MREDPHLEEMLMEEEEINKFALLKKKLFLALF